MIKVSINNNNKKTNRDFPGGPVVRILLFNAGDSGLIPDQGTKAPQAAWCGQKPKFKWQKHDLQKN